MGAFRMKRKFENADDFVANVKKGDLVFCEINNFTMMPVEDPKKENFFIGFKCLSGQQMLQVAIFYDTDFSSCSKL